MKKLGSKTNPVLQQLSVLFTKDKTPSGYTIRELKDKQGWEWVGAYAKQLAKSPLPFAFTNAVSETKQFNLSDLAFPSSKGMSDYKARELFKVAITRNKPEKIKGIWRAAVENNLDAFEAFKSAVTDLNKEATEEMSREIREMSKIDPDASEEVEKTIRMGQLVMQGKEDEADVAAKQLGYKTWQEAIGKVDLNIRAIKVWQKEFKKAAAKQSVLQNMDRLLISADARYKAFLAEQEALNKPFEQVVKERAQ